MLCPLNVYTVQREIKQKIIPKHFHKLCFPVAAADHPCAALSGSPFCTICSLKYGTGTPTSCCSHDPVFSNAFIWLTVLSIETTESVFDFLKYFVRALPDSDMSEKLLNPLTLFYRKNTYGFMTRKPSIFFFSP